MNMKKTLIAAAVAAVVAAPAASYASSTLYGAVELGMTYASKTTDSGKSSTSFFDNGSRIGLKGSNDLGNGLTGFYKLELGVNTFNNGSANDGTSPYNEQKGQVKTRLGYFGVKGDFGTVIAGRQHGLLYSLIEQPTDTPNVVSGPLNPIALASGSLGGYKSRVNAIAYVSPNYHGFVGGVAYADIGTYDKSAPQYGKQQGVGQIGVKYATNDWYVSAAYMGIPQNNYNFGSVKDVWGLAGGYKFGMFAVDANYQQAKPNTSGPKAVTGANNDKNVRSYALQGSVSMGPLYGYLQYSAMKWKHISDKWAARTTAGVFYNIAKPLQVTFEVSHNNKYVNSRLLTGTGAKANTTVALGANYYF